MIPYVHLSGLGVKKGFPVREMDAHLRTFAAEVREFLERRSLHSPWPTCGLSPKAPGLRQARPARLGARQALGYADLRQGALFFLKHGQVVRVRFTEEELDRQMDEVVRLVEGMRAADWAPAPGQVCRWRTISHSG